MKEETERIKAEINEKWNLLAEEKAMMATQTKVLNLEKENLSALLSAEKETNESQMAQNNKLAGELLGKYFFSKFFYYDFKEKKYIIVYISSVA